MRPLALLFAAVMLAGCGVPMPGVGSGPGPAPTTCTGASARWSEPGLYDALPAAAERAHLALLADSRPTTRLDVNASPLDRYHERWLQSAQWIVLDGSGSIMLMPWTPGEWMLQATVTWDNETLLANARAFLDAVGLRDHPEEKAWERAIVASRHQGAFPQAFLVAEPQVARLIQRLNATGAPKDDPSTAGTIALRWNDWRFTIEIGQHTLIVPTPANDAYQIVVDEQDRVVVFVPLRAGEAPFPTLQADTNATFARLGLPPPTYQGVAANGGC